jgi:hypothetical protein
MTGHVGLAFGGSDRNKPATVKAQCAVRVRVAAFDFADEYDMVAFGIAAAVAAFKPGHGASQHRQAVV